MIRAIAAILLACGASSLALAQSEPGLTTGQFIVPQSVFDVRVDGFKQVSAARIPCPKTPSPIVLIEPLPRPDDNAPFVFVPSAGKLTIRFPGVAKAKGVDAGEFVWSGDSLVFSWRTFPEANFAGAVKALREWLGSSAYTLVLQDGTSLTIAPKAVESSVTASPDKIGLLTAHAQVGQINPPFALCVEATSGGQWEAKSFNGAPIVGPWCGTNWQVALRDGECVVRESSDLTDKLHQLRTMLKESKDLLKTLTPAQAKLEVGAREKMEKELAELEEMVKSRARVAVEGTLVVRVISSVSGRNYAEIKVAIKR